MRFRGWTFTLPVGVIMLLVGTFGPGLSATLIAGREGKWAGIANLWKGLGIWRFGVWWILLSCALFPVLDIAALFFYNYVGGAVVGVGSPVRWLRLLVINLPLGPLWEELGWRAFLLRKLQSKRNSLQASLVVGCVWGPWHLPLYWNTSFEYKIWFMLMAIALSVLFAWVFNRTHGSLVPITLMHSALDATTFYLLAPTINAYGMLPFRFVVLMIACPAILVACFAGPDLAHQRVRDPGRESRV
jgi:uncharacterized protein